MAAPVHLVRLLTREAMLAPDQAVVAARHIRTWRPPTQDGEIERGLAIVRKGGVRVVRSRHPRNWLVNWKQLLTQGLPALVGAAVAAPTAPVPAVLAALAAVRVLVEAADVTLGPDHAEVVRVLWYGEHEQDVFVPIEDVRQRVAGLLRLTEFADVLRDLEQLGVIEVSEEAGDIGKTEVIAVRR